MSNKGGQKLGGFGSGHFVRGGGKPTTNNFLCIDVREWAREGLTAEGCIFEWSWLSNKKTVARIRVSTQKDKLQLSYRARNFGGGWDDKNYAVSLEYQPCNFGGQRVWFRCPASGCNRRVATLFGGDIFACRKCHGLVYESQNEAAFERAIRKAKRIRERLGWEVDFNGQVGKKPKGMHWSTFNKLSLELAHTERMVSDGLALQMSKLWKGLSVIGN